MGWTLLFVLLASLAVWSSGWLLDEASRDLTQAATAEARRARRQPGGGGPHGERPSDASETSPWQIDGAAALVVGGLVLVDGHPTAGVAVRLEDATEGRLATRPRATMTDEAGRFRFEGLPAIREYYRLVASGDGLTPDWTHVPGDASKEDVVLGLRTCRYFAYGVIHDASGGALEGARVSVVSVPEMTTVTDADGRYRLCVPERAATLRVDADGYGSGFIRTRGDGSERLDEGLTPGGTLDGVVVHSDDRSPVADATVALWSMDQLVTEARSDTAGHFQVSGLAAGTYVIRARAARARFRQPVHLAVFPGETTRVVVPIDRRARISGVVQSAGGPVAGARVHFALSATEQVSGLATTGPDGSFVVEDAPIGTANAIVDEHEVLSPFAFQVPPEGLEGVVIDVDGRARLEVRVLREGTPVHGARVRATSSVGGGSANTDALGVARITGLAPGSYRVHAEHEGAFAVAEGVRVDAVDTSLTLALDDSVVLEGVVLDTGGEPVDGARVTLIADSGEDLIATAITDQAGAFRGGPLRGPHAYRVTVTRSGANLPLRDGPVEIVVPEDGPPSPAHVTLVVDGEARTLEGVVVDPDGFPTADVRVSLFVAERHTAAVATQYTGADGLFTLRAVGPGPFRLLATAPSGAETERAGITLPSPPVTIELGAVGVVRGRLVGFRQSPVVMAWTRRGYDWASLRYAAVDGDRFVFEGMPPDDYYVAASSNDQATTVEVHVEADAEVEVSLVASGTRTVSGRHVDLVSGAALAGAVCQAAPYVAGERSPVVVPGAVRTARDGTFVLRDVPASDLYAWCSSTETTRGGVGRIPPDVSGDVVVYGLDVAGAPALDRGVLGFDLDHDHPFSLRVAILEPDGPAEASGLRVGDVLTRIGPTSMADVGNGTALNYLALRLLEADEVPVVVQREGAAVALPFDL